MRAEKKTRPVWRFLSWTLWLVPAVLAFAAQRLLAAHPDVVEHYHVNGLFRWLAVPISRLTSLVAFSLTEAVLVLGVPILLVLFIVWLVRLVRQPGKLLSVARLLRRLAWTLSLAYFLFMLLHGLNYARLPVSQSFQLPVRERSAAELAETSLWLVQQANEARMLCLEDEHGVFILRQGIKDSLSALPEAYAAAAVDYPQLNWPPVRPKGVLLSRYWSYTGITGMYMPLLVEANINIDAPQHSLPETVLHEIAHTYGFAREDEAGFLAFLTGLYSDNPDDAYSVLLGAALRSLNALSAVSTESHQVVSGQLSEPVRRDLQASSVYWKQFEGPVQETSNRVNDAYLQANLQEDGVRSYGRMVDLVLAWYEQQYTQGSLDSSVAVQQNTD